MWTEVTGVHVCDHYASYASYYAFYFVAKVCQWVEEPQEYV